MTNATLFDERHGSDSSVEVADGTETRGPLADGSGAAGDPSAGGSKGADRERCGLGRPVELDGQPRPEPGRRDAAAGERPLDTPADGRRARGDQPWSARRRSAAADRGRTGSVTLDRVARGGRQRRPTSVPGVAGRGPGRPPSPTTATRQARPQRGPARARRAPARDALVAPADRLAAAPRSIPTIRRCGCRTRPSISRCSSRAAVPFAPSWRAACAAGGPIAGRPGEDDRAAS